TGRRHAGVNVPHLVADAHAVAITVVLNLHHPALVVDGRDVFHWSAREPGSRRGWPALDGFRLRALTAESNLGFRLRATPGALRIPARSSYVGPARARPAPRRSPQLARTGRRSGADPAARARGTPSRAGRHGNPDGR